MKLYQSIASKLQARLNCDKEGDHEWFVRHLENIESLVREHMPRGSGFDSGTTFDADASKPTRLVFNTSFHHMDEYGGYDGWTEHQVIVSADLLGLNVRVTGQDRDGIKEDISELFYALADIDVDAPASPS